MAVEATTLLPDLLEERNLDRLSSIDESLIREAIKISKSDFEISDLIILHLI